MEARSTALARPHAGAERAAAVTAVVIPAAGFVLLLAASDLDVRWEHHPSHFWLVVFAALTTAALAYATGEAAERRGDQRLFWVSLSFLSASGFLALHALATPGVLLDAPNLGFQIAVPVGLVLAAALAMASALPDAAGRLARPSTHRAVRGALLGLMVAWGIASVAGLSPLDDVTQVERASGAIAIPAVIGAALFLGAAALYVSLARARRALLPLAIATGFALLAEAILATAFARNWHATWWEWHLLILLAFGLVAWAARQEWREERFVSLYTETTAQGRREVSVVFADLAGFTSFSESRSPAEVTEMLNAYFELALPPVIEEHGGEIEKVMGDALMATFNTRGDQPDHAERAAHAAIAIRDGTAQLAERHPDWPRFRIGVNTGEAMVGVVGTGAARNYTVIGDAVNVAARLEAAAPVGSIAIGAATLQALTGARVERLGALAVKGKREPVEAFVLSEL